MAEDIRRVQKSADIYKAPRTVLITKTDTGFGFNVRGQVSEGGQLKSINGVLYAPLQHVSAILEGGAAEMAGIRPGDRILAVNDVQVEGSTHRQVVDLIKAGGDDLKLTVISVPAKDAQRLDPDDESFYDYSDVITIRLDIPEYRQIEENGMKYVVYVITVAGKEVAKRRYSEFLALYNELEKIFTDFEFPKFPGKWPFQMSDQQLEKRKNALNNFIRSTFTIRVIMECDIVQDFLNLNSIDLGDERRSKSNEPELHEYNADEEIGASKPDKKPTETTKQNGILKEEAPKPAPRSKHEENAEKPQKPEISKSAKSEENSEKITKPTIPTLKPNQIFVTSFDNTETIVTITKTTTAKDILEEFLEKLKVNEKNEFFGVFTSSRENFLCKLRPDDLIVPKLKGRKRREVKIRKWIFSIDQEKEILRKDPDLEKCLFQQAVSDVKQNMIKVSGRTQAQLKMLASQEKHSDYLDTVGQSGDYNHISFPHCACDSRKKGHVIVVASFESFKLYACSEEGELENQVIDFSWDEMKEWAEEEDKEQSERYFSFQYQRGEKKPRWVKVFSPYSSFMHDCFGRILQERRWTKELQDGNKSEDNLFSGGGAPSGEVNEQSDEDDGNL